MMGGGYMRRKATYNAGRIGGGRSNAGFPFAIGGFITKGEVAPQKAILYDTGGGIEVDLEYCRKGLDEGWLKWTGYHSSRGIVWHRFRIYSL